MNEPPAFAAAKINLCLHVTGRRSDGYHRLDSLVAFAGVGDWLSIKADDDIRLTIEGPNAQDLHGDPADNIVFKAAHLLRKFLPHGEKRRGAALTLRKVLPVASGIGGGSADAAAALRLLCKFWTLSLPENVLRELALSLGADVPVCLGSTATRMQGVGESLEPLLPLPPVWLVLINPRVGVSTPAVFKARTEPFGDPLPALSEWPDAAALADFLKGCRNDLTAPAIRCAPVIGMVLDALEREEDCLLARMSGSGATCFGLYADATRAERSAHLLAARHPDWWIVAAPLLGAA